MKNLYKETVDNLERHQKSVYDIIYIGTYKEKFNTIETLNIMKTITYDSGYGWAEIREDLIIIGIDFIMIREEYDGSEWWNYIPLTNYPTNESNKEINLLNE